jgi:CHAD domain-containing protein
MREYARLQTAILLRRMAFQVRRAARLGDAESIHDLRVAIRRLSRCLRVFQQFYPGRAAKRIRRRLHGLMEMAGTVRDLDVTLDLIHRSGASTRSATAARLRDERRQAYSRLQAETRLWKNRAFSRKWRGRLGL